MTRDDMLRRLTALDFFGVDLHLYLNTHPHDREALDKYNMVVNEAAALRRDYEGMFGPLTSYRSPSKYPWQWVADPWPWERSFNFTLAGDEK